MSEHEYRTSTSFDALIIGTSPLLLIEALYLERQGHRVAVVEKRARIGGAWYTMPLWEFTSVQPGCHYIERGRKGYDFLEQCLGIVLEPQTVEAVWFEAHGSERGNGFQSPARWLRNKLLSGRFMSDDLWGIIKSIDRKNPGKFARAVRRIAISPPYRYPVGGSKALLETLMRHINESTITFLGRSSVERVVVGTSERPNRCLIQGRAHFAKRLIVGRHAYPHLKLTDDKSIQCEKQYAINVILRVSGEKAIAFDYLEIHRDDLINRVQDVTAYVEPRSSCSDLLICCNVTSTARKDSPVDCSAVFKQLLRWGLLNGDARLEASHVERYPNPETKDAESTDAVTIIDTYDLGVGLERNADRWKYQLC